MHPGLKIDTFSPDCPIPIRESGTVAKCQPAGIDCPFSKSTMIYIWIGNTNRAFQSSCINCFKILLHLSTRETRKKEKYSFTKFWQTKGKATPIKTHTPQKKRQGLNKTKSNLIFIPTLWYVPESGVLCVMMPFDVTASKQRRIFCVRVQLYYITKRST